MEKIKVLHITQSVGGVETYLRQVIQNIDRSKFDLSIVSCEPSLEKMCATYEIPYHHINMSRGFNPFTDLVSVFKIRSLIKKQKPALVHLHSSKAGFVGRIAAKFAGCKSLFTPHGVSYLSFTGFKRILFFMLELVGKKFTHRVLAISQSEANRCIYEIGHKEENVYVIPNSMTISVVPILVPDKLGQLEGEIKIGTIGRLTPQKNPLQFVDIANGVIKGNNKVHFHFLGAGFHDHLGKEVRERVALHGIGENFHLIEKGDSIIALNFLRQIDIFILPSIFEGLPYALLEAMLEAVPCVVSKCDGNNDVIDNNDNGYACLITDEFVSVISKLIADKEKAKAIGEAGKQYVKDRHDISNNIKTLEKIYSEL
jgi:glycosyltransferase involved in cell wall biosynthesis